MLETVSFFKPLAEYYDTECRRWKAIHGKLMGLFKVYGGPSGSLGETALPDIPLHDGWYLWISLTDATTRPINKHPRNKLNMPLKDPIEIELWLHSHDPATKHFSDEPKLRIWIAPEGMIYDGSKEFLTSEEVDKFENDINGIVIPYLESLTTA